MVKPKYITIPQLAKLMGISRIAVYRKVKKGQIRAERIGRIYVIRERELMHILGGRITRKGKTCVDDAVSRVVEDYGQVLKWLSKE